MIALVPGGSELVSSGKVGAHFGKSRKWGLELLKGWWEEQQRGGVPKVLRRGRTFYTTMAILHLHAPRGRDEQLYRRLEALEADLDRAFARIVELEQRIGKRR